MTLTVCHTYDGKASCPKAVTHYCCSQGKHVNSLLSRSGHGRTLHSLDVKQAQHFDSEKLSQVFLVLRTGFEPLVMESIGFRGRRFLPTEPPRPPGITLQNV